MIVDLRPDLRQYLKVTSFRSVRRIIDTQFSFLLFRLDAGRQIPYLSQQFLLRFDYVML